MLWKCVVFITLVATVTAEMEGYIVGGTYATCKQHPHSVFLGVNCKPPNDKLKYSWTCGASVINQMLLLTAAHCIFDCQNYMKIIAIVGDENRNKGIQRTASGFIIYKKFNPERFVNDIGIIKVTKQLEFSEKIKRVALMQVPPYSEKAAIAGWGLSAVEQKGLSPDNWFQNIVTELGSIRLKQVDQVVWSLRRCQQLFGDHFATGTFCASAKNPQDYPSFGDSGSALLVRGYIQIGLVSYKVPILSKNVLIYTDVGAYYSWIVHNAKKVYCS